MKVGSRPGNVSRAPLGQRRHELRVVADEGGVEALRLEELAHELVQQTRCGLRGGARHLERSALRESGDDDVKTIAAKLLFHVLFQHAHHTGTPS